MALSRAAAAAARKAAKSRGLKGNRAEDGSLVTTLNEQILREGAEMPKVNTPELASNYKEMSDAALFEAHGEAIKRVDAIEERMTLDRNELENMPDSEYAKQVIDEYDNAIKEERAIEAELVDRDLI